MFPSISNTLSEISNQSSYDLKSPTHSAPKFASSSSFSFRKLLGGDTFASSSRSTAKETVATGYSKRVQNDENTQFETSQLAVCSAIILMKNYDPQTGIYKDRTMFHVLGGDLNLTYETNPPGRMIRSWINEASDDNGPKKMIIVKGKDATSSPINNTYEGRRLLQECVQIPQMETEAYTASSLDTVTLRPNGKIKIKEKF